MLPGQPLAARCSPRRLDLAPARAGDAGGALGRLAVLRARLGVRREPQPEHVHADRASASGAAYVYSVVGDARARACSRPSFRGHGGEVGVYFEAAAVITCWCCSARCWSCARRSRTERRDPGAARPRADDGAPVATTGGEEDVPLDAGRGRRPAARAARREDPGRRRGARGRERGRRVDDHRRADAGREGPGDRVTGGTVNGTGALRDARRARRRGDAARADRPAWSARRSAAARRSSGWPTASSAYFVPAVVAVAADRRSSSGRCSVPSRAWPTRWSTRWRC